jgi:hypothetical protein
MKNYMTIRNKCDYINLSNIPSHVKEDKYNEIKIMRINTINSYINVAGLRGNPNRVITYMAQYSSFRIYKMLDHNYSIYNCIYRKIRNTIHNMAKKHTYPVNKYIKKHPRLIESFSIK